MKIKILSIILSVIIGCSAAVAQNAAILNSLKQKYSLTRYRTECGGWYLLGYSDRGVNYYGFADKEGNVIATNAVKYKVYKGFIELQIFDEMKKEAHDQWILDKKQYDRDYQNYLREEQRYENEVSAYNEKVKAAKKEAVNQWNAARQVAYNNAVAKYKAEQQRNNNNQKSSGWAGVVSAALSGIGEEATGKAAADRVAYQPIEDRILGERGLTVAPSKAYNPEPELPKEPSDGYEWKTFPLVQPCPYTSIDYSEILDNEGVTIVQKGNAYGLADASLKEVLPCVYSAIKRVGKNYRIENQGKIGLTNDAGKVIIPCQFESMEEKYGYLLCKKDKQWGVYTTDFEELYPCQYSNVRFEKAGGRLILYAQNKSLWGAFNFDTGQQLLPFSYGKIELVPFGNNNCFRVSRENNIGLYTSEGVLLMPCEYTSIQKGSEGGCDCIVAAKDGKAGLFDMDGIAIIPAGKYESFKSIEGLGFEVTLNQKKGYCDKAGNEILPPIYTSFEFDSNLKAFLCRIDKKCGVVDLNGKELFPFVEGWTISSGVCHAKTGTYHYLRTKNDSYLQSAISYDGKVIASGAKKYTKLDKMVAGYLKKNPSDAAYEEASRTLEAAFNNSTNKTKMTLGHRATFSFFAQNYVERVVNDWQKKGEFEKLADWKKRVNEETRQQKVFQLTKEAQEQFVASREKNLPEDNLSIVGPYDPDNETYTIKSNYSHKVLTVHVAVQDAEEFKTSFSNVKRKAKFAVENNYLGLSEYVFTMPNGNTYRYRNDEALSYAVAKVDYNFDNIDLDKGGKQGFSTSAFTLGTSDVDVKIPVTDIKQEKTFAVIIANEKYDNEKNVDFAYNDGIIFKEYCVKTLGIPAINVHFVPNAGLNQMRQQINWIKKTAEDFNGEAQFIVYYAGHGVPDDATKDAYLLPTDGDGADLDGAYKLSKLYDVLGNIPAKNVLLLMDACFSGSQRNGEVMADARGVAIKPQIEAPKGNMVVFSATTDKETAYSYKEKVHGLFTYYLLKKLQTTNGALDLGALCDYVKKEVSQRSIVVNSKPQHPTVAPSTNMVNLWRSIQIKN